MTTNSSDRILWIIDAGLQTPVPDPSFGEISPTVSPRCARCDTLTPADESEFCAPCRAYLLGDAPEPVTSLEEAMRRVNDAVMASMDEFAERIRSLADAVARHVQDRHATTRIEPVYFVNLDPDVGWSALGMIADRLVFTHTAARPRYATYWCQPSYPPYTLLCASWSSIDPGLRVT